ncbi:phosphate regulon sensor histidine kinase PhoR [Rhodoferax saidenbachensis]|uniref:Phosphate regulon sensor protein PhoR n=1 Tax=Rhodoferax saidenbachensis TaxID=1484693 RepID=A0A1P8K8R7_9BURK|nr:phosphate regulon sensor histidine kinase PhoR [Rhodoferax saidenbachensis]APW42379.1 phosphate regulon sensor histidine kinase PhoR [Rhodoferax saidenbachensis]
MFWRFFSFVLCQALPALVAWSFVAPPYQLLSTFMAALLGSYVWLLLDVLRGARLLEWLKAGDTADTPLGGGLWGEVFDRVRKLVRTRDRANIESEARLQDFLAALQASPNGVVLLDAGGRIEWFNQTAATHFGFDARRDMLQHFGNLVRDPGFASYYAAHDFRHDVIMPGRESTSSKPVKLSVHLHPYGEGRSLLLSRDITAVEQAEAMRRDFVANVSHEIRTPLTVLSGFVETLQSLPLEVQERQRYLDLMAQQALRMQTLVNDLLTLSRLEGSPLPTTQDWVSVQTLMAQCEQDARDLSGLLWTRPQALRFEQDADSQIAGSSTELHSAMSNLIGNAIRYTPADKSIDVRWQVLPDGGAVFSVKDQGPGIAPEHIPRLTERFYRVDRSRSRETGGTGLGLAIVKHVAQRHGAELGIESLPGNGSRFSITFPAQRVRENVVRH